MSLDRPFAKTAAIRSELGAIFVSLELSRSTWLVTSLSPGGGEKLSRREIKAGDVSALLARLVELRHKALARTGTSHPIIVIQEAGLDGFWLHRVLEEEGCESHVVDPASVAAPRRRRRAKTDRIDGEAPQAWLFPGQNPINPVTARQLNRAAFHHSRRSWSSWGDSITSRSRCPLPCSTRSIMRPLSMSDTFRWATSDTLRPAP